MNKLGAGLIVLLLLGGIAPQAMARDAKESPWDISVLGGAWFPKEDDQDASGYVAGRLTYNINEHVGVGIESGWASFGQEADVTGDGKDDDLGDIQAIPLLANLFLRLPLEATENKLVPYAVGSVGVIFWDYNESSLLTSNNISIDGDTSFAARVGGGADFYITDNVAIFAEGGYLWSEYEAQGSIGGVVVTAPTVDTNAAYAVGGLKIAF